MIQPFLASVDPGTDAAAPNDLGRHVEKRATRVRRVMQHRNAEGVIDGAPERQLQHVGLDDEDGVQVPGVREGDVNGVAQIDADDQPRRTLPRES